MRLRIDKIWFIVVALVLSVPSAHAQIVTANPLEWMALAEGNEAINGEIEKEIIMNENKCSKGWVYP